VSTERLTKAFEDAIGAIKNPAEDCIPVGRGFLEGAIDHMEWMEKGLAEWRDLSRANARQAKAARATARIAIAHLQAVLNHPRTHAEQQAADTAARDWLESIGSEPTDQKIPS
jgi:hypothetical protein